MLICKECGDYLPDISYEPHQCRAQQIEFDSKPVFRRIYGVKCDMCGSTAIDHNEMQCQLNRVSKLKPKPQTEEQYK